VFLIFGVHSSFGYEFDDLYELRFAILLNVIDPVAHSEWEPQSDDVEGGDAKCHGLKLWSPIAQAEDAFHRIFGVQEPSCGVRGVYLYQRIREARCFSNPGEPVVKARVWVAECFLEEVPRFLNVSQTA
jgi:hypothetical protein